MGTGKNFRFYGNWIPVSTPLHFLRCYAALVQTCQCWCIRWCHDTTASFLLWKQKKKKTSVMARCIDGLVFVFCCFCYESDAIGHAIGGVWRVVVVVFLFRSYSDEHWKLPMVYCVWGNGISGSPVVVLSDDPQTNKITKLKIRQGWQQLLSRRATTQNTYTLEADVVPVLTDKMEILQSNDWQWSKIGGRCCSIWKIFSSVALVATGGKGSKN